MGLIIYWTGFAKKELQGIFNYHKENASLKIAKSLVFEIEENTHILMEHPQIGQKEALLKNRKQEFRYLVFKNYKIIYWVNKQEKRIEISDIFDTRQNPIKMHKLSE